MPSTSYLVAIVRQPNGTYTVGCGGCKQSLARDISQAEATRIANSHRCTGR